MNNTQKNYRLNNNYICVIIFSGKVMQRKCIGCGKIQDRRYMIKITKPFDSQKAVINGNSKTFGRSVYLCYNNACIENAFKKNKISKNLKTNIEQEVKGKLLNELRDREN